MNAQLKIAEYLDKNGIKKTHVAATAGIRVSRFSQIVNNHVKMRADELEAICKALNVSPTEFIEDPLKTS